MTTDNDLIARACRWVDLWYSGVHEEWTDGEHYFGGDDNPALHALLVWKLQKQLGVQITACDHPEAPSLFFWHVNFSESTKVLRDPAFCKTIIEIIRVLVDALEGTDDD